MTLMTTANCRALEMEPQGTVGGYPYRLFHTADGAIFVGVAQNKFGRRCAARSACPSWA